MNEALYSLLIIAVMAAINFAIRGLPFVVFHSESKTPKVVEYLGRVLPPAMMSFLVVYCLRSINLSAGNHGIPDLIGVAVAALLHAWKRNTLLSISVATVLYMILIRIM